MGLEGWIDLCVWVFICAGALLCLIAAIGVVRFRTVPNRLHAATKPQVLGVLLMCAAVALDMRSWQVAAFLLPVVLIQFATVPLAAHLIGREAVRAYPEQAGGEPGSSGDWGDR